MQGGVNGSSSTVTKAKKLSKVQILRAAIHYIDQLQHLLMSADDKAAIISDAGMNSKLSLQTQYSSSSNSSSSARVTDDDVHNRCPSTDVKRKSL